MNSALLRRKLRLLFTVPLVVFTLVVGVVIWFALPNSWPNWPIFVLPALSSLWICVEGIHWRRCRIIVISLLTIGDSGHMSSEVCDLKPTSSLPR